ncbi:DNA-3-methyladenine glycosylase I [Portibacter marinus]|uniref:DNA-3-methyladenine glycosylase I n=1 Tax=Portibacter marinus TaxID=2898660 RepID=UPI001F304F60|nr:DNA-3-methyladenine glycosylase I [Portibacter marinus]
MAVERKRCGWVSEDPLYIEYHDKEWGVPVHDDRLLFEMLNLEGAQAGLSWITVLKKRKRYQEVFDHFDAEKIITYDDEKIGQLLNDPGIIRNKLKVNAVISNALAFLDVQKEFGSFDAYIWQFVDHKPILNQWICLSQVPAKTEISDQMSKDLKKRGFKFVGSTICYAYMQACGMVNDHTTNCFRH